MVFRNLLFALILFISLMSPAVGQTEAEILDSLRDDHPRLIARDNDVTRVRDLIKTNPEVATLYAKIKTEADDLLDEPLIEYTSTDYRSFIISNKVLLQQSRRCLYRVYTLLTVYRIEGGARYADRAKAEIMRSAELENWNPKHFLDVAEMTHAVAIGYDWLYHDLSESEREILRQSIVEKGLKPALRSHRFGWFSGYGFDWTTRNNNWNQVCNGGITMGALAIADHEPEIAEEVLGYALESIKIPMAEFAPDGAWEEGPGYWSYATEYNVNMLAGLMTALGTDYGLSDLPGFDRAGDFRVHYIGPLGMTYNYADANPGTDADEQMFWLARRFNKPLYAWHARKYMDSSGALALWWYDPRTVSPEGIPKDVFFESADVVLMRSAWDDPDAIFIGFKGGDNMANHGHLDLGSFIMDANGVRWAIDLGKESYKLPLYFDRYITMKRWTYYRTRTESHNTLLINGKNQDLKAVAPIIKFNSTPDRAFAVADLTEAYKPYVNSVHRGIAMVDRSRVVVQDEIEAKKQVNVAWGFVTAAEINMDGKVAHLSQDGANLAIRIIEPEDAYFEIISTFRPPPEKSNEGTNNLTIQFPEKVKRVRIVVELIPYQSKFDPSQAYEVFSLKDW